MDDDQIVEMVGFDADGIMVGRAAIVWATGNWTVSISKTLYCNIWGKNEVERLLRQNGAVHIQEGTGKR